MGPYTQLLYQLLRQQREETQDWGHKDTALHITVSPITDALFGLSKKNNDAYLKGKAAKTRHLQKTKKQQEHNTKAWRRSQLESRKESD